MCRWIALVGLVVGCASKEEPGDDTGATTSVETEPPVGTTPDPTSATTVTVAAGDVATLASLAADPAYAGYTIRLAPGVYALGATLALQPGQRLVGANGYLDPDGDGVWDPIDGSDPADPTAPYVVGDTETVLDGSARGADQGAVVALGAGGALETLTVRGAGIDAEKQSFPFDALVRIDDARRDAGGAALTDVLVTGGSHGVAVNATASDTAYDVTFTRTVVLGNDEGLSIGGSLGEAGMAVTALLDHVRITGGWAGFLSLPSSSDSTYTYTSHGTVIDGNSGQGVLFAAGFSFGGYGPDDPATPPADRNVVTWSSSLDTFTRNGSATPGANGAILLHGALDFNFHDAVSSGNQVLATFEGPRFVVDGLPFEAQNLAGTDEASGLPVRRDVSAVGANFPFCGGTGTDNRVEVTIVGGTSDNDDPGFPCVDGCTSLVSVDDVHDAGAGNTASFPQGADLPADNAGLGVPDHYDWLVPACGT